MKPFTEAFGQYVYDGQSIEGKCAGFTIRATLHLDADHEPPWDECGHGPVTRWVTRDPHPWEITVATNRYSKRYYDFSAAVRLALKDGWGLEGGRRDDETPRAYAKRAAEQDAEIIRAWCNDEWQYYGVVVIVYKEGIELADNSLWGIEGNYPGGDNSYLLEVANDLANAAIDAARQRKRELCAALCDENAE